MKIRVRALKSVPSFGLVQGQFYLVDPYAAQTMRVAGFVEFAPEKPRARRREA
jgi:hypothetical protein